MTTSTAHGGRSRSRRIAAWACLSGAVAAAGCAAPIPRDSSRPVSASASGPTERFGPAYQALRRLASRPVAPVAAADAPPPAGLDPDLATPINPRDPDAARATLEFDAVLRSLLEAPSPPRQDRPPASPEDRLGALRRYVAGRTRLLSGDARGAIGDFRAAIDLDPSAPEPWRELGEAQLAIGSHGEAAVSFQAAVERGLAEARALEFLGSLSESRGDPARAAEWYARARAMDAAAEDPALPVVIAVGLGRSLLKAGYLEAGRTALARALELPFRAPGPTRYAQELAATYRRQGELWRDVGDADLKLGQYGRALSAYERAADLPAIEDVDLAPRVFFAATRAGQPAAAAIFALDRVAASDGLVTRDDLALMSSLSSDRAVAVELSRALAAWRDALPADASPTVIGSLARARAAVVGGREGVGVLRGHLRRFPGDAETAARLLAGVDDPVGEAARLTADHPEYADRYADCFARARDDADRLADAASAARDDASRLLGAYLHTRLGALDAASRAAAGVAGTGRVMVEGHVARARLAAAQGRWADAEAALANLDASRGAWERRARARALWSLRRAGDTLDVLRPLLDGPEADRAVRLDDLLLAGEAALRAGRPAEAEEHLVAAGALDPHDDRASLLLLSVYAPSGQLPDADKLARTLRGLRDADPDSRVAAFVRAQEFARRSFFDPAERELRRLADADPTDPAVMEMLSAVWVRRARGPDDPVLAQAAAWLRERRERRPWARALTAAYARVLASSGREDEAEALLREHLSSRPSPEVSRVLETLLRERGRADEADALADARLARPHRSIDEAIELVELCARREDDAGAAAAAGELAPPGAFVTPDESRRLLAAAEQVARRAMTGREGSREPAARLLDALAARGVALTPELHDQRLALLASLPGVEVPRLVDAALDASRQFPTLGAAAYLRVCQLLVEAQRIPDALRVAEAAAERDPSPDVLSAWVRLVPEGGTHEDARRVIERAVSVGRIREVADRLLRTPGGGAESVRDPRAAIAYEVGVAFASLGRQDEAIRAYELALEYDPRHAWACNNLGYGLVETGGDLGRAEALLQIAFEELPDDASILDSLAWLRYKQGVLDSAGVAGHPARPGAVELLERAARTDRGRANATIQDHLGDALWLVHRRDEARQAWERAERLAAERLREVRQLPDDSPGKRELRSVRESARRKLDAVNAGADPPVAPRAGADARSPADGG